MDKGYLTSGQFAKMARVSVRTVRFYDKQNILKPSFVNETTGARYYTTKDLVKLQQILLYKYLGFSLEEIKELMVKAEDKDFMVDSMKLQQTLISDKLDQMQLVKKAVDETLEAYEKGRNIDWDKMLRIIDLTSMENSLNKQYQNASNVSARIKLHKLYSVNKEGWFPWIFGEMHLRPGMKILELGCGNGALWAENSDRIPSGKGTEIVLSDISGGMLQDAKRTLNKEKKKFSFREFGCESIPYPDGYFDAVIANHMLFYCENPEDAAAEIRRVLAPGGVLYASTYGSRHMKEITELVKGFDDRIDLAARELYHIFGLDNGAEILETSFDSVEKNIFDDALLVDKAEPLMEYIMSCHGNQNQYIVDRYQEFKAYIEKKVSRGEGFRITKEAGYFKAY
jgi:DNA-binding transcriptional MerR regulator/ubiquinone/menaquinone biosynthesis C-methylase UbiE